MTPAGLREPDVVVAGEALPFDEAIAIATGYCLGEESVTWSRPPNGVGGELPNRRRGAFAYRSYDGIPAAPTSRIEPIDILVADGLNAQMRARDIAAVLAVADDLSSSLEMIDSASICFWELERDAVVAQPTTENAPGWPLWRAWTILRGVEGVDLARSHKILHHKRPRAFPLIDNMTIDDLLADGPAWGSIHRDLTAVPETWGRLEDAVAELTTPSGLPPPTRLRLHDILLWTRAAGRRGVALGHGRTLLGIA